MRFSYLYGHGCYFFDYDDNINSVTVLNLSLIIVDVKEMEQGGERNLENGAGVVL